MSDKQPSKAAIEAAEKFAGMMFPKDEPTATLVIGGVELYSVNASQGFMSDMADTIFEIREKMAKELDAFVAPLVQQAEGETVNILKGLIIFLEMQIEEVGGDPVGEDTAYIAGLDVAIDQIKAVLKGFDHE